MVAEEIAIACFADMIPDDVGVADGVEFDAGIAAGGNVVVANAGLIRATAHMDAAISIAHSKAEPDAPARADVVAGDRISRRAGTGDVNASEIAGDQIGIAAIAGNQVVTKRWSRRW